MLDIRQIRAHPDKLDASMIKREMVPVSADILRLDSKLRALQQQIDQLRHEHSVQSAMGHGQSTHKAHIKQLECDYNVVQQELMQIMLSIPNIVHDDVQAINVEVRTYTHVAERPNATHEDHVQHISKDKGVRLAGSRFCVLEGDTAQLARKLAYWLIEMNVRAGYREIQVPHIFNQDIAQGMGVLPKFEDDLFKLDNGQYLIPTSEGALVGMHLGQQIDTLPLLYTCLSECFRSEAGSAGRDTAGLIRLHQFSKVEIAGFVQPDMVDYEHERLVAHVERLLQLLQLSYRVLLIAANDLGFHAHKKYDLEVWMPLTKRYLEISSCSQCGDFQSRRLGIKGKPLPYTINGSALPIQRLIACMIETHGLHHSLELVNLLIDRKY